jgi:Tfp pilus assembly protein PilP
MKINLIICCFALLSCHKNKEEELQQWKAGVQRQSEKRVDEIIRQLEEDCDSSLMQMARTKADSILQNLNAKRSGK